VRSWQAPCFTSTCPLIPFYWLTKNRPRHEPSWQKIDVLSLTHHGVFPMANQHSALIVFLSAAMAHCVGGSSDGGSAEAMSPEGGEDHAEPTGNCPPSSVSAVPTGACDGAGKCAFEIHASCGPGVTAVPATPPVYLCDCIGETWSCRMQSGGFSLMLCPEAGTGN
jgi:hypothetical protein